MSTATSDLNDGPVAHQLWRVSAPMSFGIFSVLAIGLADAYFLARLGGSALAAVGFVYPVIVAVSAFSVGLSAGANTALSQARGGESSEDAVARLALHATGLGLAVALAISLVFWLIAPWLFGLLGAEGDVLDNVMAYLPYWIASFPLLVVTMILNAAFRAAGDGVTAAVMMVLTAVLNIALTPTLIFGYGPAPEMEMAGAGFATLLARAAALVLVVAIALRRGIVALGGNPFKGLAASAREIIGTALPSAFSRAINPAGMAIVTAAVAVIGDTAVAGFGAASRVQSIALVPFFALAAGLGPVVGQAWGAGDEARAREAMRVATWFALIYGAVLAAILVLAADPIARFMTAADEPAAFTAQYLRFVGWSLCGYGLAVAANAALTGRSRAGWAMGLSLTRIGLVYVPFAWLGVMTFGYGGILAAAAATNIVAFWGALVTTRANGIGPSDTGVVRLPAKRLATLLSQTSSPRGQASS
ncbi:MAG: MATE family efflux transporter [Pseudomonadota bacterium]